MDGNDVGVFELAGDLSFLDEAGLLAGVGLVEQVLDGHFAADVAVDGPQDGTHAAAGDLALDDVASVLAWSAGPGVRRTGLLARPAAAACSRVTPPSTPALARLLVVPSIWPAATSAWVLSGAGTTSGCLQVGHRDERPANSGFTLSFMPQWEQEKEIMGPRGHNHGPAGRRITNESTKAFLLYRDCVTRATRRWHCTVRRHAGCSSGASMRVCGVKVPFAII